MRKLMTRDVMSCCRFLKRLGLKEKVRSAAAEADSIDTWDKGFDLIWSLFDAATEPGGEAALYDFLAGPFEMTPEEVGELGLPALLAGLQQIVEENDLAGFFGFVGRLMKSS